MNITDSLWAGKGLKDCLVIDAHAHMGYWQSFYTPQLSTEQMLNEMDRYGIDVCCISSLLAIAADTHRGNAEVLDLIQKTQGRFKGYITLNPHDPQESNRRELLERISESSGFIGIKFHPMWHGVPLDGELYRPLWDLAAEFCPLVVGHSWLGSEEPEGNNTPDRFASVAERYPQVTIIMGHSGGTYEGHRQAAEYCHRFENLYMDLCASEFSCLWLEDLLSFAPAEKVLFATDMPFLGVGSPIGRIGYSRIDEATKESILGQNMKLILEKNIRKMEEAK